MNIEVQRCIFEIDLAVMVWPDASDSRASLILSLSKLSRSSGAPYPHAPYPPYPPEYVDKLFEVLRKDPSPIVRIALERLVRAGYPDLAIQVQTLLRTHTSWPLD